MHPLTLEKVIAMSEQGPVELDLADLLPEDVFNDPRCFDSHGYFDWEREVAAPLLEAKGFKVCRWWSEDEDSFGPLVRAVELEKDGKRQRYFYG